MHIDFSEYEYVCGCAQVTTRHGRAWKWCDLAFCWYRQQPTTCYRNVPPRGRIYFLGNMARGGWGVGTFAGTPVRNNNCRVFICSTKPLMFVDTWARLHTHLHMNRNIKCWCTVDIRQAMSNVSSEGPWLWLSVYRYFDLYFNTAYAAYNVYCTLLLLNYRTTEYFNSRTLWQLESAATQT